MAEADEHLTPPAEHRSATGRWTALRDWLAGRQSALTGHAYRYPMAWMLVAILLGIQCAPLISADWLAWLLVSIPALLIGVVGTHRCERQKLAACLAFCCVALFAACYAYILRPAHGDALSRHAQRASQPIALRGTLESTAQWRPNPNHRLGDPNSPAWVTQWNFRCEAIRDGQSWQPLKAYCSLSVDGRIHDLLPGDVIQVLGSYRAISPPNNPGAFDFSRRAAEDGQFVRVSAEDRSQITRMATRPSYALRRARAVVIHSVDHSLREWVAFNQAPLAAALVFGQRAQVDWEDQQELMATGTLHLLAISGMHVGFLAVLVLFLCRLCGANGHTELLAIAAVCGLYAALAGGQPPVLRAVILIGLLALARSRGRNTRLTNILSLAAIVLLVLHVSNATRVGVHLSFLAVASMGVFALNREFSTHRRSALQSVVEESYGPWQRYRLRLARAIAKSFALSFWVWLMTSPLIWLNFHVVAPIAIPLNVLIALPLMISLLSGLLTGLLGWIAPVGWLGGNVTGCGLQIISWMVSWGNCVPLGHVWLPAPPVWWVACFYIGTLAWLLAFGKRRRGLLALLLCAWMALGVGWYAFGPRGYFSSRAATDGPTEALASEVAELRCTFLDVGHGTSVILELPSGAVWLYDAGHLGASERSHQEIAAALWDLPTSRIEKLIISHADADHYNATCGIAQRFQVGYLVSTERFWQSPAREVARTLHSLDGLGIRRITWDTSHGGQAGPVQWQVLHPRDSLQCESDNASSLCLLLEYAGQRILLPGDLEGNGLLNLLSLPERPCHALMAPHHGSLSHDPSELLDWCQPKVVVISGNHRATRPEVLAQYNRPEVTLGVTFRDGAIQLRINSAGELSCWHWAVDHWAPL